jgi:hypothetical protein
MGVALFEEFAPAGRSPEECRSRADIGENGVAAGIGKDRSRVLSLFRKSALASLTLVFSSSDFLPVVVQPVARARTASAVINTLDFVFIIIIITSVVFSLGPTASTAVGFHKRGTALV